MNNPNNLSYLVSSNDLQTKIKHPFKLVQYKDLFTYQNLNQLLPNTKLSILIILINTAIGGGGHWTCLIRQNNLLTYFDSYGKKSTKNYHIFRIKIELNYMKQNHI